MGDEPLFLSKKDFASHQGWSPSYVSKLATQGKLVMHSERLVDVEATLARLRESADPSKHHVSDRHEAARTHRDVGRYVVSNAPETGEVKGEASASDNATYWTAKSKREAALADIAELELAKARKQLVEADSVYRALTDASRMMRDMLMSVPSRVAGQVISAPNAGEAQKIIATELRGALDQFSKIALKGLERAGCVSESEVR